MSAEGHAAAAGEDRSDQVNVAYRSFGVAAARVVEDETDGETTTAEIRTPSRRSEDRDVDMDMDMDMDIEAKARAAHERDLEIKEAARTAGAVYSADTPATFSGDADCLDDCHLLLEATKARAANERDLEVKRAAAAVGVFDAAMGASTEVFHARSNRSDGDFEDRDLASTKARAAHERDLAIKNAASATASSSSEEQRDLALKMKLAAESMADALIYSDEADDIEAKARGSSPKVRANLSEKDAANAMAAMGAALQKTNPEAAVNSSEFAAALHTAVNAAASSSDDRASRRANAAPFSPGDGGTSAPPSPRLLAGQDPFRVAEAAGGGGGGWDLPPPPVLRSSPSRDDSDSDSVGAVDPREGGRVPRLSFASSAAPPPGRSNHRHSVQLPRRSSGGSASSYRSSQQRPGAVHVAGPGRAPPMPSLTRQAANVVSSGSGSGAAVPPSPPRGAAADGRDERDDGGVADQPRRDDDADVDVDPTVPAPPLTFQERRASLGETTTTTRQEEIDLIPRVEATLVTRHSMTDSVCTDDDDEGEEDGSVERDEELGGTDTGWESGRTRSAGTERRRRLSSAPSLTSGSGPITVDPVDFAHAVAIPADSVIPIPEGRIGHPISSNRFGAMDDFLFDDEDWSSDGGKRKRAAGDDSTSPPDESNSLYRRSRNRIICASVVCLLVTIGAVVGSTINSKVNRSKVSNNPNVAPTPEDGQASSTTATTSSSAAAGATTTTSTALQPREVDSIRLNDVRSKIQNAYEKVLPGYPAVEVLNDMTSDQYSALLWLARDDPARVHDSYNDQLIQRYAAAAVYFGTGGKADPLGRADGEASSWLDPFYWLSDRHECNWIEDLENAGFWGPRGIACDERRRVNVVSLYSNNLTGTIPVEVAFFDQLDLLYLVDNDMGGSLPSEMGRLNPGVAEIMMSLNPRVEGTIPSEIGNLSDLQKLSIWGNELTGTIPTELGRLTNLERLTLRNCSVTGDIPKEMARNSVVYGGNLVDVYVQFTELTGSMEHLCPNITGAAEWEHLESDCLREVECSCCTECF